MSQQFHEEFHADRSSYSGYEGHADYNYYSDNVINGQKLSLRVGPPLWQRIGVALFSLLLWGAIILCFRLAWGLTSMYDYNTARIIIAFVPLLTTPLLIYMNVLFNRKRYESHR